MKLTSERLAKRYSYDSITQLCHDQIVQFIADANRHTANEARYRQERAYGVYMGWRALVAEQTDSDVFSEDDRRLEALLVIHPYSESEAVDSQFPTGHDDARLPTSFSSRSFDGKPGGPKR